MKRLLTVGALFGTLAVAGASGQTAARAATEIPLEVVNNLTIVSMSIEGSPPLETILDTGAGVFSIDADRAAALNLKLEKVNGSVGGAGETRITPMMVRSATGRFGPLAVEKLPLAVYPLTFLRQTLDRPVVAVIGYDLLSRFVVDIDHPRSRVVIHDPKSFTYSGGGRILPLEIRNSHLFVKAAVTIADGKTVSGDFMMDTGASGAAVLFFTPSVAKYGVATALPKVIEQRGQGVGGDTATLLGRARGLTIAGFTIERPTAGASQTKAGSLAQSWPIGLIGNQVWRRFRLILDVPHKRAILEPGPDVNEPFVADMSGLGLIVSDGEPRRIIVRTVSDGTPAAAAGIAGGDEIVTIDGRPATELRLQDIRELLKRAGTKVDLGVKHGETTRTVTLALEPLI
jgi:hypothetical protein